MSSILDALRRLERDQPDPMQAESFPTAPPEGPRRPWGRVGAIALVAVAIVGGWVLWRPDQSPVPTVPDPQGAEVAAEAKAPPVRVARRDDVEPERGGSNPRAVPPAPKKIDAPATAKVAGEAPKSPTSTKDEPAEDASAAGPVDAATGRPLTREAIKRDAPEPPAEPRALTSRLRETRERAERRRETEGTATRPSRMLAAIEPPDPTEPYDPSEPNAERRAPAGGAANNVSMHDRLREARERARSRRDAEAAVEAPVRRPPGGRAEATVEPTETADDSPEISGESEAEPETAAAEEVLRRPPRGAPRVRVSFLFYSQEPSRRRVMLTIDGGELVTLFEGQAVDTLAVARILPDEVHFRHEGTLFAVKPR